MSGRRPVPQAISIISAEIEKSFLEQLRENFKALFSGQMEQASRLRDGRRQAAHVAEFAAHALDQFLVRRFIGRLPRQRRDAKRPDGNVKASVRKGEWLACGCRHAAGPQRTASRYAGRRAGSIAQLQLSNESADTQDQKETARVKAGSVLSRIQARAAIRFHAVRRLPRRPRQLRLACLAEAPQREGGFGVPLALLSPGSRMTSVPSDPFHILVRALLMCTGASLLRAAPDSIACLVLMLVGLVCAVGALTFEKTQQF